MAESNEYRSALRAVSQVSGADGGVSKPKLTIDELEGVITPEVRPSSPAFLVADNGGYYQVEEEEGMLADNRTE